MMPLMLADIGENLTVMKVGGKPEIKKHLENLGFVPGNTVSVVTRTDGNIIVKIMEARVAISREMAQKIMIA